MSTANVSMQMMDEVPVAVHYDIHPCREDLKPSAKFEPHHILIEWAAFNGRRAERHRIDLGTRAEWKANIAAELNGEAEDAAERAAELRIAA